MKMGHYLLNILIKLSQAQESDLLLNMMKRSMNGIWCNKNQIHQQLSRVETLRSNKKKRAMIIIRIQIFPKKIKKRDFLNNSKNLTWWKSTRKLIDQLLHWPIMMIMGWTFYRIQIFKLSSKQCLTGVNLSMELHLSWNTCWTSCVVETLKLIEKTVVWSNTTFTRRPLTN